MSACLVGSITGVLMAAVCGSCRAGLVTCGPSAPVGAVATPGVCVRSGGSTWYLLRNGTLVDFEKRLSELLLFFLWVWSLPIQKNPTQYLMKKFAELCFAFEKCVANQNEKF